MSGPVSRPVSGSEPPVPLRRIRTRADYRAFLAADLQAHGVPRWHVYLRPQHPELHYQRLLRAVEFAQAGSTPLARLRYVWLRVRLARLAVHTGISIPPGTTAAGLSVAHCGSIVVHDQARIGTFCRMHSGVNIGGYQGGVPTIGDRVYLAPGAVVYGAVTVGNGAVIGANAVVNSDVPPGVTVAGAPARLVARRGSETMMPPWFPSVAPAAPTRAWRQPA